MGFNGIKNHYTLELREYVRLFDIAFINSIEK